MSWTAHLLALLASPDATCNHQAARMLALFATPADAPALAAILLDRDRDPWVRIYVLRAFEQRGLALDAADRATLLAEIAATSHGRFAQPDVRASLEALAHPQSPRPAPPPVAVAPHDRAHDRVHDRVHDDVATLLATATSAPHVVLRARAIRALAALDPRPAAFAPLCLRALAGDREVFDRFYAPVVSEAAIGLARHAMLDERAALAALVEAGLQLVVDDAWWAIEAAIASWIDHRPATIRPVWDAIYQAALDRAHG